MSEVTIDVITSPDSDQVSYLASAQIAGYAMSGLGSTENEAIADLRHELDRRHRAFLKRPSGFPKTVTVDL